MKRYNVVVYKTAGGKALIHKFFKELMKKNKHDEIAQIKLYMNKLEEHGMDINREFAPESIKPLRNGVYELRPGKNRVCFFIYKDGKDTFVILNGFRKKGRKTPKEEIDTAVNAMKEYNKGRDNNE